MDKYLKLQGFYTDMAIVSVNPGDSITAQKYNEIQAQVDAVLGKNANGYGYTPSSIPVTRNDIIKATHYTKLYNDIRRCRIHQAGTGVTLPGSILAPEVGDEIEAAYTNNLITAADQVLSSRYAVESGQLSSYASPQSLLPFNASYTHTVVYEWDTSDEIRYFFNLGGRLTAQIGYIGSASNPLETLWVAAVATANAAMLEYTRSDFASSAVGVTKTLYTNNGIGDIILVTVEQISGKRLELKFQMQPSAPLTIGISSQGAYYYSRGDLGGVASPLASVTSTLNSGSPIVVIPTTRILTVTSPSNDFTFANGGTSSVTTYTLTNNGNASLTISGITFSNATGINSTPSYPWSFPLALGAGDSQTFTLTYSGSPGAATWNSSFTLASSNNDAGNVIVQTRQIVSAPAPAPFGFSLDYSAWYQIASSTAQLSNQVFILPNASYNSYTAAWDSVSAGFSFSLTAGGPTVYFNPGDPGITNGTYNAVLRITIQDPNYGNFVSRTFTVGITRSIFETRNLGTWVSPLSFYNAVIGASYDIINDQRFLTLGIGMGADSSPDLDRGGIGYVDPNNLSFTADDNYLGGPILYPAADYTDLPTFLRPPAAGGYAGWPINQETMAFWGQYRYAGFNPNTVYLNYTINCPAADTYTIEFGMSRATGFCTVDGNLVVDLRNNEVYAQNSGSIYLGAGQHTLTIAYIGQNDYLCILALRMTGSGGGEVWTTRYPMRTALPFRYWSEVYRIPIYANGTVMVHQSANYRLKATRMIEAGRSGYTWGDRCGVNERSGSMFTAIDDGSGNLVVELNAATSYPNDTVAIATLINLANPDPTLDSFMYWTPYARYRNLEDQNPNNPSYSSRFYGFTRDGAVRTISVPNYQPPVVDNTTGVGGFIDSGIGPGADGGFDAGAGDGGAGGGDGGGAGVGGEGE